MRRLIPSLLFLLCVAGFANALFAQTTFTRHTYPHSGLLRGDFNRDGKPDLLGSGNGTFRVLLNNGDGTFRGPITSTQPGGPRPRAVADFNRDGRTDLVGCHIQDPEASQPVIEFAIWLGTGAGTFSQPRRFSLPALCDSVAVEDFNQDGNHDAAVLWVLRNPDDAPNNGISVFFGDGAGSVSHSITTDHISAVDSEGNPCALNSLVAGNYDRAGSPDVMVAAQCTNFDFDHSTVLFGIGTGTGHFGFSESTRVNRSLGLGKEDLNQDGRLDLFAFESLSGPHASSISGVRGFISTSASGAPAWEERGIYSQGGDGECIGRVADGTTGDFNGDGIKDAAFTETFRPGDCIDFTETYHMGVTIGRADGSYSSPQKFSLSAELGGVVSADFDRDGRLDLAVGRGGSTEVFLNRTSTPTCTANAALRTVKICAPATISGNTLHLRANTTSGGPVTGMKVYLDNSEVFFTPNDMINKKLTVPAGSHRLTVRAWDSQGSFSSSMTVTAGSSTCATPSTNRSINICSPANESTVSSPVRVTAAIRSSNTYHGAKVFIDGVSKHTTSSKQVNASFTLSAGKHRISVQAYDTQGAFTKTVFVNVR